MASKITITCPHCGKALNIDDLYTSQMDKMYEEENARKLEEAKKDARSEQDKLIRELTVQIKVLRESVEKAKKENDELLTKQIELKQEVHDAKLSAKKELEEKFDEIYQKEKKNSDEENASEIATLKKKVVDANEATEAVKRKLEQGSQQLQGEIQELELKDCLCAEFPMDIIEDVEKGRNGADVIQTVVNKNGKTCGKIVWECKNVKNWSNTFIPKLRDDVNRVNGDIGILVSNVFGKDMADFSEQDGVWLVKPGDALSMARVIRKYIIGVSEALIVVQRKVTVQDAVYALVTSPEFRGRLDNIGRRYIALKREIENTERIIRKHCKTQYTLIDDLVGDTQNIIGEVNAYLLQAGTTDKQTEDNEE